MEVSAKENFTGPIFGSPFTVSKTQTSYVVSGISGGPDYVRVHANKTSLPNQGAAFNAQVRNAINQYVQAGRMVTIEDIRVKGPDGRTNKAPSLLYYIK